MKDCLQSGRRPACIALGKRPELSQQRGVNGKRIARGKGRQPAFRCFWVRERVLRGLAKTKHRRSSAWPGTIFAQLLLWWAAEHSSDQAKDGKLLFKKQDDGAKRFQEQYA